MQDDEPIAAWMDADYDAVFSKETKGFGDGPIIPNSSKYDAAFEKDPEEETPLFVKEKKNLVKEKEIVVRRSCCHSIFIMMSTYSSISLLCLLFSQGGVLYFHRIRGLNLALRCYVGLFGIVLLLVEVGIPLGFLTESGLIANWSCRGIIHSFLGLINEVESLETILMHNETSGEVTIVHEDISEPEVIFQSFQVATSWMMVGSGVLYFLMGLCCLDRLRTQFEEQYKTNLEKAKMKKRLLDEEAFKNM